MVPEGVEDIPGLLVGFTVFGEKLAVPLALGLRGLYFGGQFFVHGDAYEMPETRFYRGPWSSQS